jgi:hypothetical protein
MEAWNETIVRERFQKRADELVRRLPSIQARAAEMQSFRIMHDEMLAKLSVYRVLLDDASLGTRDSLMAALVRLSTAPPAPTDAIDPPVFVKHCREFVAGLAGQYRA